MRVSVSFAAVLVFCAAGAAQVKTPAAGSGGGAVARGEYIVNYVAQCVQCHTPRTSSGDLDRMQLLHGAPIPLSSPWPNRPWAVRSVHIAGLPGFSDADVISILTRGARPDGRVPQPPMPQFRMTQEDATAVVAYLRTLK